MSAVAIRILLRYLAAVLVTKAILSPEDGNMLASDPDVAAALEMGVGIASGAAAELWMMLAKRFGWRT